VGVKKRGIFWVNVEQGGNWNNLKNNKKGNKIKPLYLMQAETKSMVECNVIWNEKKLYTLCYLLKNNLLLMSLYKECPFFLKIEKLKIYLGL